MGMGLYQWVSVLDCHSQAGTEHGRKVDHVVAHEGRSAGLQTQRFQQGKEGGQFISATLRNSVHPQVGHTVQDYLGGPPSDHRNLHTGPLQHLHAVSIPGVECLVLLAAVIEEKASVSENPIHVEYHQPDIPCPNQNVFSRHDSARPIASCLKHTLERSRHGYGAHITRTGLTPPTRYRRASSLTSLTIQASGRGFIPAQSPDGRA